MSDPGDIEAVRAEVDRLKEEVARLEARPREWARARRIFTVVFLVIAVVAFSAATPGVWARRTVYDPDRYIAVVGPLGTDPAVQEALARRLTTSVFEALDIQGRLRSGLADRAPKLVIITGPITSALQGFVQDQVQTLMASDRFQTFWHDANLRLHDRIVAVLNGESDVLQVQGDQVVFNYLPIVNDALAQLSQTVSDLLGRSITLPTITPDTVPSEAISMLEGALGVTLPDTFGSVVLFRSDSLTSVQDAVSIFNRALVLAVILFVVATVIALVLSTNRRRTLVQLATALIVVVVLERRFAIAEANDIVRLASPENQAAAAAILHAFLGSLLLATERILWILFAVLVVALATGPDRWAVRVRAWSTDVVQAGVGVVRVRDVGPATVWIAMHRDAAMLIGAIAGAAILLFANISVGWSVIWLLVLAAYELSVYRIAATVTGRAPV